MQHLANRGRSTSYYYAGELSPNPQAPIRQSPELGEVRNELPTTACPMSLATCHWNVQRVAGHRNCTCKPARPHPAKSRDTVAGIAEQLLSSMYC
jgi:hypothetical protein